MKTLSLGLIVVLASAVWAEDKTDVLPKFLPFDSSRSINCGHDTIVGPVDPKPEGLAPWEMLAQYLIDQVDDVTARWEKTYESLDTPEKVHEYQSRLRQRFIEAIGGCPERTLLNTRITGIARRPGYRVEMVLFESQPGCFVTGNLFVPESDTYKAPYPGVLVPCGHFIEAKAAGAYQSMGALLALNGMVGFVFDPIDQGERIQVPSSGVTNVEGHDALGPGSVLLGRNTSYFYRWDAVRALDYLESRPEVDPARLGCTGNSGGGTQTLLLSSSDVRIVAAAPSCSLSRMASKLRLSPGDIEQHVYGQLVFGLDEHDYVMMRAPDARWFICTTTQDFVDIHSAWWSVRYAKRLFTRLGFPERLNLLEEDAPHSYGKIQREAVARWMTLWLKNENSVIEEPKIDLFTEEELRVTPRGSVMLLDGARTAYDLNADYERELAQVRQELWRTEQTAELLHHVREIAGIRPVDDLPALEVKSVGAFERFGAAVEKLILKPEKGIYLPALLFLPKSGARDGRVLYLHEKGISDAVEASGVIETLVRQGRVVLAVDVRGTGETEEVDDRRENYNYYRAHDLGRSIVGMQAEDVLWCARYLATDNDAYAWEASAVTLAVVGAVGVPALHAAALEQQLFANVQIRNSLVSWDDVVHTPVPENQLSSVVHGALKVYDLPDLVRSLGSKIQVDQPLGANGRPLDNPAPDTQTVLLHQWRFDGESDRRTPDSVGGADAVLCGAAMIRDGSLDLSTNPNSGDVNAAGAGWVDLPIAKTLAALDRGATFEAWITEKETHKEAKLWSFGSSSFDEMYLWPEYGNGYSHVVAGIRVDKEAPWRNACTSLPLALGQPHHIVVTFYGDEWTRELKLYVDGNCCFRMGAPELPARITEFSHCFLARHCEPDNQGTPLWSGKIHEFRVHKGALTYEQIRANFENGPVQTSELGGR